jgi:hypothetical protein
MSALSDKGQMMDRQSCLAIGSPTPLSRFQNKLMYQDYDSCSALEHC